MYIFPTCSTLHTIKVKVRNSKDKRDIINSGGDNARVAWEAEIVTAWETVLFLNVL